MRHYWHVFLIAFRLGCTSFGGPAAHIGYFREEYVVKRKWLDEQTYASLVALANFLPGPASSQVGIAIGTLRAGIVGGFFAWLGFTLPSVFLLTVFAFLMNRYGFERAPWIQSLKLVAVAVVAQAVFDMGKKLAPDRLRQSIVLGAAAFVLVLEEPFIQIITLIISGIIGYFAYQKEQDNSVAVTFSLSKRIGVIAFGLFFILLLILPILNANTSSQLLHLFDSMYRTGSLVFGGGHVVLPLLEQEVAVNKDTFLAGYALTQAMPGPLFTFASYVGTVLYGIGGTIIATVGIFLPGFLLMIGGLSFWNTLQHKHAVRTALLGVNAGVVGILLAALYDPIFTDTIKSDVDIVLVLFYFVLFHVWKVASWKIVSLALLIGLFIL
ncbi:chromate efflux transporter [Ectobacillus antri]|uniref:Chromate efflux transporter n=1 Tax=Ectobacillus antri TaxID=2486280 RepID=A0ABT6H0K6_9BACI|nr:chromate efflux transporter [Ectobacillus antri]MDG4655762.1 chromate efflux transporter [Ectobacillus antri]MDG5752437.1 chromate efflux transporter [Ectobacillus antri]